jgi:xylitol oxidase
VDKRTFLKLCSVAMTSRALSPLSAWSSSSDLTNWAGNFEYSTDKQHSATSMNDIQEFVKRRSSLKVLGTRHCFNKIADSTSEFLSLR